MNAVVLAASSAEDGEDDDVDDVWESRRGGRVWNINSETGFMRSLRIYFRFLLL
jgi:hypothetical protein